MTRETRAPLRDGLHMKASDRDLGLIDNQLTDREPPSGAKLIVTLWIVAIFGVAFAVWRLLDALVGAAARALLAVLS
jgi:hypothetical protein